MSTLHNLVLVFIGGGCGAVARYLFGTLFSTLFGTFTGAFYGTLAVNILGSFLIGISFEWADSPLKKLLIIGCLGGFTTFSTFSAQTIQLLLDNKPTMAILYVSASLCVGLAACWLGVFIGKLGT